MRNLARIFKALGDPTRLALLTLLLREGELCVCDCEQALRITQSKASRHLRYLAQAGLVVDRRVGPWVHYRVVDDPDRDRSTLLEAARAVLAGQRGDAVLAALARWREQKATEGLSCPSPATGTQSGAEIGTAGRVRQGAGGPGPSAPAPAPAPPPPTPPPPPPPSPTLSPTPKPKPPPPPPPKPKPEPSSEREERKEK